MALHQRTEPSGLVRWSCANPGCARWFDSPQRSEVTGHEVATDEILVVHSFGVGQPAVTPRGWVLVVLDDEHDERRSRWGWELISHQLYCTESCYRLHDALRRLGPPGGADIP